MKFVFHWYDVGVANPGAYIIHYRMQYVLIMYLSIVVTFSAKIVAIIVSIFSVKNPSVHKILQFSVDSFNYDW